MAVSIQGRRPPRWVGGCGCLPGPAPTACGVAVGISKDHQPPGEQGRPSTAADASHIGIFARAYRYEVAEVLEWVAEVVPCGVDKHSKRIIMG